MAHPILKLFNYYRRYKWKAADFTTLQTALIQSLRYSMEGLSGSVGGMLKPPTLTFSLLAPTFADLMALAADGTVLVVDSQQLTFVAPGSNSRRDLIVLRKVNTNGDNITRPTTPFDTVPLTVTQDAQLVVITGTPGASPAYPSIVAGDIVVCGLLIASAQATIAITDLDFGQMYLLRPNRHKVRRITVDTTLTYQDEIVEVDATAGTVNVTMPLAKAAPGQEIHVVKVDAGSNLVNIIRQGADNLGSGAGTAAPGMDTQDQFLKYYSNGVANWRQR